MRWAQYAWESAKKRSTRLSDERVGVKWRW